MGKIQSPEEFQIELFALIQRLLPTDGVRFNIYVPNIKLHQEVGSDQEVDSMVKEYDVGGMWQMDPMHPSHFEESNTVVVSNSLLMSNSEWRQTQIFKKFFEPHGFFHNADVFFRQKGVIIAVLSLLRHDEEKEFLEQEIDLLKNIQPFIQYTLRKVYLPKRVHNRESLAQRYEFTNRELDVVELALTGASNKVLIEHLKISMPTLRTHMQNIYSKVGVHSSSELISTLLNVLR